MSSYRSDGAVGPWAEAKLSLLEKYLNAYTQIVGKHFNRVLYFDAFAGTGMAKRRGSISDESPTLTRQASLWEDENASKPALPPEEGFIAGSPVRALSIKRPFTEYHFVEKSPQRYKELSNFLKDHPLADRCNLTCCDAHEAVETFLKLPRNSHSTRGLIFLDPYGLHVPWSLVEKIADQKIFEVIINLPIGMTIQRMLRRKGLPSEHRELLTEIFGTEEWLELLYAGNKDLLGGLSFEKRKDASDALSGWYRQRLENRFGYTAIPVGVKNTKGHVIYHLFHAGPNKLGANIVNDIVQRHKRKHPDQLA